MKLTPELLEQQWNTINYKDGGFLQIDTEHPLEWHIGYLSIKQKALLLISDVEIDVIDSSKSISVRRARRESDNRWTLTFELLRDEQQDVFIILCNDIIEYSRTAINPVDALELVISRYKKWSRLLEHQRNGLMDEAARKGLIGELLLLNQLLANGYTPLVAVQGWIGADGADQDFIYADSWHEVKSIGVSATSVSISSLEQLDNEDDGELVVMRIDKSAPERRGAFSLNEIVLTVKDSLQDNADAIDVFQNKLSAYGYIDLPEYSMQKYYYSGCQKYHVNATFPKLVRVNVPQQVNSVKYDLNLPALTNWIKE